MKKIPTSIIDEMNSLAEASSIIYVKDFLNTQNFRKYSPNPLILT